MTIQDYMKLYRTIQGHKGICRTIQNYTGLYRTIQDYIKEYRGLNRLLDRLIKMGYRQTVRHTEFVES